MYLHLDATQIFMQHNSSSSVSDTMFEDKNPNDPNFVSNSGEINNYAWWCSQNTTDEESKAEQVERERNAWCLCSIIFFFVSLCGILIDFCFPTPNNLLMNILVKNLQIKTNLKTLSYSLVGVFKTDPQ